MIGVLGYASYLLPIISFLVFSMKKAKWELWVIFFYVLLAFGTDFLLRSPIGQLHSQEFIEIFTICEFTIFSLYFYSSLKNRKLRRIILFTYSLVLIFLVYNALKSNKEKFDSINVSTESVTIIVFCVIFFFEEINKPLPYVMYNSPSFWIILAILIYMASTLFLFIIAGNLSEQEKAKYWTINSISNIISNVIFAIAFIKAKNNFKNPLKKSQLEYNNIPENHRKLEP